LASLVIFSCFTMNTRPKKDEDKRVENSLEKKLLLLEERLNITERKLADDKFIQLESKFVQQQERLNFNERKLLQSEERFKEIEKRLSQSDEKFKNFEQILNDWNRGIIDLQTASKQFSVEVKNIQEFIQAQLSITQNSIVSLNQHMLNNYEPTSIPVILDDMTSNYADIVKNINSLISSESFPCKLEIYSVESFPHGSPALYALGLATDRLEEFFDAKRYNEIMQQTNNKTTMLLFRYGKNPDVFPTEFPDNRVVSQFIYWEKTIISCDSNNLNLKNLTEWIKSHFSLKSLPPKIPVQH